MRKLLNGLYDGSAWLAGIAMIGVLAMVLLTITSRLLVSAPPAPMPTQATPWQVPASWPWPAP
jgi:TRAP-type C4-dicarboxylate transport system permease small subunit